MKTLKQILKYSIWVLVAILLGVIYMKILLGPYNITNKGIGFIAHVFYCWGMFYIGLIVGLVIAFIFILFDIFYLNKKLQNKKRASLIRFYAIFIISIVVGITHYILEKVIDII